MLVFYVFGPFKRVRGHSGPKMAKHLTIANVNLITFGPSIFLILGVFRPFPSKRLKYVDFATLASGACSSLTELAIYALDGSVFCTEGLF